MGPKSGVSYELPKELNVYFSGNGHSIHARKFLDQLFGAVRPWLSLAHTATVVCLTSAEDGRLNAKT